MNVETARKVLVEEINLQGRCWFFPEQWQLTSSGGV